MTGSASGAARAFDAPRAVAASMLRAAERAVETASRSVPHEDHRGNDDWPQIQATLRGDGDAFAELVRKYQETIAAQMWRLCREQGTCEELTHEVFVEAYLGLRQYRGEAPLVHWLRRIATRVGYRYYKSQAARRAENSIPLQEWDRASEAPSHEASRAAEQAEAATQVHTLLAKLPPRDRLVLTLVYLEGASMAEAAELTGWSETMVKVQTHRARKKLKKLWESHE